MELIKDTNSFLLLHANLMIGKETCSEKQVKICYVIVLYISVF